MLKPALRICAHIGCHNLVKSGYCDSHQRETGYRHDPERQRLYDRKWQARRRRWLSEHPWCEECLSNGLYVPATDVHHLRAHRGDRSVFISSELESLCHACHSQKTAKGK